MNPRAPRCVLIAYDEDGQQIETCTLERRWIDFDNRRVSWPDSKTGDNSKPMSEVPFQLLSSAPRINDSPYVCPAIFDSTAPCLEAHFGPR